MTTEACDYSGKTILVTGGLGFLGSVLAKQLARLGAKVRVLDSLAPEGSGSPRNLVGVGLTVDVVVDDIRNRDAVQRAVRGADVIFHFAGVGTPGCPRIDWVTDLDVSCLGTLHILEAMRIFAPEARLVFASSTQVYGVDESLPVNERARLAPMSLFGAHKAAGEHYLSVYRQRHGLDVVSARIADVFGPAQRLDSAAQGTVLHVIDTLVRGETPACVDDVAPYDLTYVDDAAAIIRWLGVVPAAAHGIFNVASGIGMTGADVARLFGVAVPVRRSNARGFIADISAIQALGINITPTPLKVAFSRTATWFGHHVL